MIILNFPPKHKKEIIKLLTVLNTYHLKHNRYPDCYGIKYDRKLMCFMNYEGFQAYFTASSNLSGIKNISRTYIVNANLLVEYCIYCLKNNKMKSFNSYIKIRKSYSQIKWKQQLQR